MNTLAFHWTDLLVLAVACSALAWLAMEDVLDGPRKRLARLGSAWYADFRGSARVLGFILVGDDHASGITGCITCLGVWINMAAYPLFIWLSGTGWSGAEWWQHGATFLALAFATTAISARRKPSAPSVHVNCPR